MEFEPIAIVGRACLLPGANTPGALWQSVVAGQVAIGSVPADRWRVNPDRVLGETGPDGCATSRGGYVTGFDAAFSPLGFRIEPEQLEGLDPLFLWTLHTAREALREADHPQDRGRVGAILGNLSFPSAGLSAYAEAVWTKGWRRGARPEVDPRNRFMSGFPAHLLGQALGLGAGCFALDAACASSLYAIKLACDQLHDRAADLMLAGAVNCADDLFIHVGFNTLTALSPTGQSRPFDRNADGLVPAEGAGFVALKRLDDALRDGNPVQGVIRGVGLSNDGRGQGFLVPQQGGQVRAMRAAYAQAGLPPSAVSYVECHATGTSVGDATELRAMAEVFGEAAGPGGLPIGSLKANLGHAITASGVAGLIKLLEAMEAGTLPPTPSVRELNPALAETPFRVLAEPEPWPEQDIRRAGLSAFGFGGNNAHLVLEQWTGHTARPAPPKKTPSESVAVVALGARVAGGKSTSQFVDDVLTGRSRIRTGVSQEGGFAETVGLNLVGLTFPPTDLQQTLAQQTLLFAAAREAVDPLDLPAERTAVFVGYQCDPEIARYGVRWRAPQWAEDVGEDAAWISKLRDGFAPPLQPAGVLGTMPNIPASRLSRQFRAEGPSFTVASEELSGVRALAIAQRALLAGEVDAAIVGAVDLSCEPVHQAALGHVAGAPPGRGGDAAVVLVLRRIADARNAGEPVLAILNAPALDETRATTQQDPATRLQVGTTRSSLQNLFGHPHAASGLLHVAAGVVCCDRGIVPEYLHSHNAPGSPPKEFTCVVECESLGGQQARVSIRGEGHNALSSTEASPPGEHWVTLPAHPPPPALPTVGDTRPQPMPRAPTLGSVFADPAGAPAVRSGPTINAVQGGVLQHHAALTAAHTQHVEHQAHAHRAFLRAQRDAAATLLASRTAQERPQGPSFTRAQLEEHASGVISHLFGDRFRPQDAKPQQVRMPEPPLLLADRVVGLDATPAEMGTGTVWTETDIPPDAWYLNGGSMPAGILVEAGQADLFLISYLGADLHTQGDRVYRLLGCELTFHRALPTPGETLTYKIDVDGHATHGDVRLFFFHYHCQANGSPMLSVREGQAGFFSEAELAASTGVLWRPEPEEAPKEDRVDPPVVLTTKRQFSSAEVEAFSHSDTAACFGEGFESSRCHTRTPKIQSGRMRLIDRVEAFVPGGGPWERGYLRAVHAVRPDNWYFEGHFKNDPCMPGTLMLEGCFQAMAFYTAALGYTLDHDGWRFEPVTEVPYPLQCRGQVRPNSSDLTYEVFVREIHDGPVPTLYADVLCTCDGLGAFHARGLGLQLVPDWPQEAMREAMEEAATEAAQPAAEVDGFVFNHRALLACALGPQAEAFGPPAQHLDGPRKVPRLPAPPYHFMSRVREIRAEQGVVAAGGSCVIDYDIPSTDAWYFRGEAPRAMPFCVLLEAALQPCGWLASFIGSAFHSEPDLFFRNLDGRGTVHAEVWPEDGNLQTEVTLVDVSRSGATLIQSFNVQCLIDGRPLYDLETKFGFFPKETLQNQVGLPTTPAQRALLETASSFSVDLTARPKRYFAGAARLPEPMLLMLDRVTALDEAGGAAGRGFARAEMDVDPGAWFFKAHFFQDPVQPGSLGLEAMIQLIRFYMLRTGLGEAFEAPQFESIALEQIHGWKFRGQVVPSNRVISTTLEVLDIERADTRITLRAQGSLWVDGKRIYEADLSQSLLER